MPTTAPVDRVPTELESLEFCEFDVALAALAANILEHKDVAMVYASVNMDDQLMKSDSGEIFDKQTFCSKKPTLAYRTRIGTIVNRLCIIRRALALQIRDFASCVPCHSLSNTTGYTATSHRFMPRIWSLWFTKIGDGAAVTRGAWLLLAIVVGITANVATPKTTTAAIRRATMAILKMRIGLGDRF